MTKDEALKLALDFVASVSPSFICEATHHKKNERHADNEPCPHVKKQKQTYEAIKEALAQPEQEPVATDWERIARVQDAKLRAMCNEAGGFEKLCEVMDKYEQTTPPQRKPLTDEEIESMWPLRLTDSVIQFARAIEAAHGIKGEA